MTLSNSASHKKTACGSGIVIDGYSNLVAGVCTEARQVVEEKYADEWRAANLYRRWKLRRIMDAEIKELAAKLMPNVSREALF